MLSIKELVIKNNQQDLVLVDHLSFTLNENDKIAIIGSEGSGKSTLLSVIYGNNPKYISFSGTIIKPKVIAYLEQNIEQHWHNKTVLQYLEDEINKSNRYDYYDILPKLAQSLSLSYQDIKNRNISDFSGGERVKIGIMKALMIEPDLLLLDEPSNDIDFETLLFLENFLIETFIPVLFVSHDQRLLERVSNGIIHLQQIHKKSKAKTIYSSFGYTHYKENELKKFESDMMVARKQRSDYKQKMEKFNQIYQKVEYQQNQAVRNPGLASLLKKKIRTLKSQEKRFLKEKEKFTEIPEKEESMDLFFDKIERINKQKEVLDLDIKNFKLKDGKTIDEIKLSIHASDKIVITGHNGVGKTTLIRHLIHLLEDKGIKYGYISQDYTDVLDLDMTALDFLLLKQSRHNETKIRQILGSLGLKKDEMLYKIKDLSEGTKLKVMLLLLVSLDVQVIILDEPTRNISPLNQDELYELFLSFKGALIAVTHDRSFIEYVFNDIYELTSKGLNKL